MSEHIEVKSIDRGYGKSIKIKIANWKDVDYIDIREYYTDSESAEELPTKKGVRFPKEIADEVIDALNEAKEQMQE
jgi:Transcriptional Coactivator p15 (PC4).